MLLIDDSKLLSDLYVHLFDSEGTESDIEEVVPCGVEVEGVEMLIEFGVEIEGPELLEQVIVVTFGSLSVDAEDRLHELFKRKVKVK